MSSGEKYLTALLFAFLLLTGNVMAQVVVSGFLLDESGEKLPGATIKVLKPDSEFVTGTTSGENGEYSLKLATDSKFLLVYYSPLFVGKGKYMVINTRQQNIDLGKLVLKQSAKELKEVKVEGVQSRGEQKGDTTSFNSAAFKTNPDATAEDLVKKMPGITSDNTGIKVNGETVQRVLVDGKPFFGDDAATTLKSLPAEIIEKVQVFDKMSDQAQFTGFSDGEQQKTINLVTKRDKNKGQFGRIYAGAGADQDNVLRYNTGAALNSFSNKRRITLLLLSNNVNQQNFSSADMSDAAGSSGQRERGRQGGQNSGLSTQQQNGNSTTHSAGLNYSDLWGKKVSVSGSYYLNYNNNQNRSDIVRSYFSLNNLIYGQSNTNSSDNFNHRLNARLEYSIDSANKITINPSLSFQNNQLSSLLSGSNSIGESTILSSTKTDSKNKNSGYDFNNNLLFMHKFKKYGRSVSVNLNTTLGEKNNDGNYYSNNLFADSSISGLDQVFTTYSFSKRASANISYTEPLNQSSQILLNYSPSYSQNSSDKTTEDFNPAVNDYSFFNSNLSNQYSNTYLVQKAGAGYRYNKGKLNINVGADAQQADLNGTQVFPTNFVIKQKFNNVLPNAMLNYRYSKGKNLRFYYRTSTNIPGVAQLQDVVDISNPLQVRSGNSSLLQTFDNNVSIRIGGFNNKTARNAMLFFNASQTNNYISNATYIFKNDTLLQGLLIKAGSQLTKPVNLNGNYTARAFFVYGFPLKKLKSNMNVNGGLNYAHVPGIINYQNNFSNNYAFNGGVFIGSNINENIDFSINYNGNYTIVRNTAYSIADNSFFSHMATFKINWILFKNLVLNTDISHSLYNGLSQNFNQQYLLWNGFIGYKFLKNKSLELKLGVFDILNKNRSINRRVTEAYTEDSYTVVLRRYGLITLTYRLSNFKNGSPPKQEEGNPPLFPGGRPPGMKRPDENNN